MDPTKPKIGVTARDYVVGAFIPTILAVLFSIPWHLLHSAIKEIEPFYQLHNADGVSTDNSLTLDYRASVNVVATFTAMRKRRYLVWWSGIVSLIILLLPPLASETVFIGFVGQGRCTATSGRDACIPELSVFPVAGLASLFQDQRLIEDFRRLNPYATPKELRNSLRGNRYRVGTYGEVDGSTSYCMTLVHTNALPMEEHRRTSSMGGKKYASVAVSAVDEQSAPVRKKPSSSPWIHPAIVVAFSLFILGLEALIIYHNRVGGDMGFERFMNSEAFLVSFLFTAIGVILKMYWNLLDDGKSFPLLHQPFIEEKGRLSHAKYHRDTHHGTILAAFTRRRQNQRQHPSSPLFKPIHWLLPLHQPWPFLQRIHQPSRHPV